MLRTTCTCTQEWSDIPRRSEVIWAMYHHARTRSSALTASRNALQLAVAPRRRVHLRLGDRLRNRIGPNVWPLCFHSAGSLQGAHLGFE